jgi:hypothetical protein
MNNDNFPHDDAFDDIEGALRALRPRGPSAGFADRVSAEARLRELSPLDLSADFADRVVTEGRLREVTPVPPPADFADGVITECALHALRPKEPSAGFADRVVLACAAEPVARRNILSFPRVLVPLAAAAALALALAPVLTRFGKPDAPVATVASATPVEISAPSVPETEVAATSAEFPEEALSLPVINLGDGRSFRPVLRRGVSEPSDFRAMPGGAVMPVSFSETSAVDYEPVNFE